LELFGQIGDSGVVGFPVLLSAEIGIGINQFIAGEVLAGAKKDLGRTGSQDIEGLFGRKAVAGEPVAVRVKNHIFGSRIESLENDFLEGGVRRQSDLGFDLIDLGIVEMVSERVVKILNLAKSGGDAGVKEIRLGKTVGSVIGGRSLSNGLRGDGGRRAKGLRNGESQLVAGKGVGLRKTRDRDFPNTA
jgi:hypothetical protein